jgi:hypothetical protein
MMDNPPNHRTPNHCVLCKNFKTRAGRYPVGTCKKYDDCDTCYFDICDDWEAE